MNNFISKYHSNRIQLMQFSFTPEAVSLYKLWFSDPQVRKQMGYIGDTIEDIDIKRWEDSLNKKFIMLNIVLIETQRIIGICSVSIISENNAGEIEMLIGEKGFRNKGFGTEALKLLVCLCDKELNLKKIKLRVLADNFSAIKCYKKVGFITYDNSEKIDENEKIIEMVKFYN